MPTVQTYGVKALRRIQGGREVTPGTLVPPTWIWRGVGELADDTEVVVPVEDIGVMLATDRGYVAKAGGTLTLKETVATYEQLPYFGELGLKALLTGVADGAGSGKIYAYPFPISSQVVPNNYSFEAGDNALMELVTFGLLDSFKLSGTVDKSIMMSGVVKTRAVNRNSYTATTIAFDNAHHITDTGNGLAVFPIGCKLKANGSANNNGTYTVTASAAGSLTVTENTVTEAAGGSVTLEQTFTAVAVQAVKDIVFNQCKLYIDDASGTIGTTQLAGTFLGFEFDYDTGLKGQPVGDGRLDFSFLKSTRPSGKLKLKFEMENNAKAEKAKWTGNVARGIRIKNQGPLLTTAGTSYTNYTMILDILGKYTKFNPIGEDSGNDIVEAELDMGYDITAAQAGQLLLVNQLATLV